MWRYICLQKCESPSKKRGSISDALFKGVIDSALTFSTFVRFGLNSVPHVHIRLFREIGAGKAVLFIPRIYEIIFARVP